MRGRASTDEAEAARREKIRAWRTGRPRPDMIGNTRGGRAGTPERELARRRLISDARASRESSPCLPGCKCSRHPEVVSYHMVHNLLLSLYGPARDYDCIGCGEQAHDWSFSHDTPEEFVRYNEKTGFPFSIREDPRPDYDPRCKKCHNRYDRREP